jgi:hypothetical protein
MLGQRSPENTVPQETSLADALRRLADELNRCSQTLRETHDLVSPQLDELERKYTGHPTAPGDNQSPDPRREAPRDPGTALSLRHDQRSLGRAQGRRPA